MRLFVIAFGVAIAIVLIGSSGRVPFTELKLQPDAPIQLYLEAFAGNKSIDRVPREGTLELVTPTPDFELVMWQA